MVDPTPIIGRERELAVVRTWLAEGRSGLVEGPPGIGKSTLVDAALAGGPGPPPVRIRGLRHLHDVPLLPVRLVLPGLPAAASVPDAVAELLRMPERTVLVVDDLHSCDPDTLAVVRDLVMRRPVLATTRSGAEQIDEVREMFRSVGDALALGPLSDEDSRALVRRLRPGAPPSDVAAVLTRAAGNPHDLWLGAQGHGAAVVDDAAVVAALARDELVTMVEVAAGAPVSIAAGRLRPLLARGVVRVDGGGRAWPAHDRLADAALAAIDAPTLASIHRALAQASDAPAVRAVHFAAAGDRSEAAIAARRARRNAPSRWSAASFLRLEAANLDPPDACRMLDAADALSLVARYDEGLDCLAQLPPEATAPGVLAVRGAVVRARAAWALTDAPAAREAIAYGLDDPAASDAQRSELLGLRARIRGRIDWDLAGSIADGEAALALAGDDPRLASSAHSALGLTRFISGDPGWTDDLEAATHYAVADVDVHEAVTIADTMIFGHLLSGDPARSRVLAEEMVEFTEPVSAAWNGYFRAVALLTALHVDADHAAVRAEATVLLRRPLSVRATEACRTALGLALVDDGDELAALDVAEGALLAASDDSARSTASWVVAETAWLVGDAERALAVAMSAVALPTAGYPGSVNAALMGHWAARDLGRCVSPELHAATQSGFPNLAAARVEAEALCAADPAVAARGFRAAADAWRPLSRRAAARARWATIVALVDAGAVDAARADLSALAAEARELAIPWLDRRVAALARAVGAPRSRSASDGATGAAVMARVARGQPTPVIARGLSLASSTVETHVRAAIRRTGARTRLEAAMTIVGEGRPAVTRTFVAQEDAHGRWSVRTTGLDDAERRACLPGTPLQLDGGVILVLEVTDAAAAETALLAVARGAGIDVVVSDPTLLAGLLDGLTRFGTVTGAPAPTPAPELDDVDRQLVAALVAGHTVVEAAAAAGYSRRQAQRRLAALRRLTGASTNAEAVAVLAGFGTN
ncbi:MAG: LuxR C-terminal-related transcriptional regulator [Acidimicrobiia bacterium]